MCTLSILRSRAGRVVLRFNRDEQRDRVPGGAFERVEVEGRVALRPLDPEGGGTWIGVNDAGLVCCLLNRTPLASATSAPTPNAGGASRGSVVASLLGAATLDEVVERSAELARPIARRWRLIATDGEELVEGVGERGAVELERSTLPAALLRASSGLGDDLVLGPRREAFERSVLALDRDARFDAQAAFHALRWPERGAEAPDMSRASAWTVSRTAIDLAWDDDARRAGTVTIEHADRIDEERYAPVRRDELAFDRVAATRGARA